MLYPWSSRPGKPPGFIAKSIEPKVDLDCDLDWNRGRVVHQCGLEFVLSNCFDCFLVQSHPERTRNVDVSRFPLRIDDETDKANTLIVGTPRFICVPCGDPMLENRGADSASDFVRPGRDNIGWLGLAGWGYCAWRRSGRDDLLGGDEGSGQ
jgi:hypothetical protein